MRPYIDSYLVSLHVLLGNVPVTHIEEVLRVLSSAYERSASIFIIGNGGSASNASHWACDLSKTTLGLEAKETRKRFKAMALSDHTSIATAWANDDGYEHIFSEQIKTYARDGDVVLAISASGNSPNIVKALEVAREMELHSVGVLGFDGGRAKDLVDARIVIESKDYGLVEGAHSVLGHMITGWLSRGRMREIGS